jgi:ribonucleotide reductase beta subunit family protein with ferritin-like domain
MEMVKVKTSDKKYAFKIQGKMVTFDKAQRVNRDHNVHCKLNEGVLVLDEEKKEIKKEEKKKKVFTPAPAMSENNGRK